MRYWSGKKQRRNFKEFHHPREFENPFFRKGGAGAKKGSWRLKIDILILAAAIAGWSYFLFFSPYFSIKDVTINGNKAIAYSDLSNYFSALNNKNIFLLRTKPLENAAGTDFILKDISIKKIYPASIQIDITEREPLFDIVYNDRIYLIDGEGIIFKELSIGRGETGATTTPTSTQKTPNWRVLYGNNVKNNLPLIEYNVTKNSLPPGSIILKPKIILAVKNIFEMEKISSDFIISYIEIKEGNESQITAKLTNGLDVYFDGELNIDDQINNLKILLNGKLAGKLSGLKYIDLRFGERVYFK